MMKIIKKSAQAFRKECDWCGCIFEYDLSEINKRDGVAEQDTIKCPGCGKEMAHHGKWDSVEYKERDRETGFLKGKGNHGTRL